MSTERTLPKLTITELRRDGSVGMKYKPLELIGSGGSAIAFSAAVLDVNDNPTDQVCLLKEFYPTGASRDENDAVSVPVSNTNKALRIQFLREVSAGIEASQYIYGATTATNSFESENRNTYIVMPYEKHGMSLKKFCKWLNENGKTIPMRAWARLFQKLSDRIRNLHENAGILHSDISVGNVMIMQSDDPEVLYEYVCSENADYTVILLDFGCAYFQDDVYIYESSDILTAEKRDVVFTTNEFASPELQNDSRREITTYTDIYSIVACFKYCINAVESGDKYIFSADIPATAKAQVEKILSTLNADESEYVYKTRVLIEMFDELIRRIDGKGISKAILWETGNKDISSFKRSADFDIVESILPSGRKSVQQTEYAHLDGGETKKLEDLITETKESTYLIGEGGIGKTTSLIHYADGIYQKGYTEESVVPVYIELGNCTMDNAGLSSKLIHRYILSRMTGATLAAVSDEQISELSKLFSAEKSQPEYILMLDGLNEVSDRKSYTTDGSADRPIVTLLIYEITQMIQYCKNVRVILTSRNDNESLSDSSFQRIYITGLKDEEVNQFLNEAKISDEKRQAAKNNPTLMEILRIPLFLSIYTRIADSIDATELSTRGEHLKAFFNEKRKDMYSQIGRVDKLHNLPLTGEQYAFILEYVLPQICWEMVHKRTLEIDSETIYDLIYKALSDDHPMYIGFGVRSSIRRMAASLKQVEDEAVRSDPLAAPILNAIKNTLSVFYKKSEDSETKEEILRIRHQHFRDYFAALYFIGLMKSARSSMARMKGNTDEAFGILQEIRDEVVFPEVLIFVGEILGEHRNAPVLVNGKWTYNVPPVEKPQDRNLIKRTLDAFRGRFDGSVGYGIYNLVEILKKVRKDLSREDLGSMDLSNISLNGVVLGGRDGGVLLADARIFHSSLFPVGHSDYVVSAVFNCNSDRIITASMDGSAKVWDAATGTLLLDLTGHKSGINHTTVSHDGTRIITSSSDNSTKVWDASTGNILLDLRGHRGPVYFAAFNSDSTYVVTVSWDKTAKIWDVSTGKPMFELKRITYAAFNPDGTQIVTTSNDGTARVWNTKTGELHYELKGHSMGVYSAAYSPDGARIVTISHNAKIWDATTGMLLFEINDHKDRVTSAAFNKDHTRIITASSDHTAKLWDTTTGEMQLDLKHSGAVEFAAFSGDYTRIVTTSDDGSAKVWDAATGTHLIDLKGHSRSVNSAAFSHDSTRIVTASDDGTAKVWDTATGAILFDLKGTNGDINYATYNIDATRIVSTSNDGTVKIWNAKTGTLLLEIENHSNRADFASINHDSTRILTISYWDNTVNVWNLDTGELILELMNVNFAKFNREGTLIITTSENGTAKIWDASTGVLLTNLIGNKDRIDYATFNINSTRVFTISYWNHIAKVWNVETGMVLLDLENVTNVKFICNGTRVISCFKNGTSKVWDAATGELLINLNEHCHIIDSSFFNCENTCIISVSDDGTEKVWNAETGTLLLDIKEHNNRVYFATVNYHSTRVITLSQNNKIAKVWDVETGTLLLDLKEYSNRIRHTMFNRNGTRIITSLSNGSEKVWDTSTGELLLEMNDIRTIEFNHYGTRIISVSYDGTAKVWNAMTGECLDTIKNIPGLIVKGVDLRHLHSDCTFTDEDKEILRRYGAII